MRFRFPNETCMTTLFHLTKKLYTKGFYEFIEAIKQTTFYITNGDLSVVVVVDAKSEKIDIFSGKDGLLTCHNLFSGNEKGLVNYGFSCLSIESISTKEITYSGLEVFLKKYRHYHKDGKTICYISSKIGQNEGIINDNDAILLVEVLQYLFHIKKAYDNKEIEESPHKECVAVFEFDDINYTYQCNLVALDSFDFLPTIVNYKKRDKNFASYVDNLEIVPGTLYIGLLHLNIVYEHFQYSNQVNQALYPLLLYFASDTGVFSYTVYSSLNKDFDINLHKEIINQFMCTKIYDTVVTDNYLVYLYLVRNLTKLGITVQFDSRNFISNFFYKTITTSLALDNSVDTIFGVMDEVQENYEALLSDIEALDNVFDPFNDIEIEEEDEEDENDFVTTDTKTIS